MNKNCTIALLACVATLALAVTGCGGGSSAPAPADNTTADLHGQLLRGNGGGHLTSAASGAISNAAVTLVDSASGAAAGHDVTDDNGNFDFYDVPGGREYDVTVDYASSNDLDGDGSPDNAQIAFPVTLAEGSTADLTQTIDETDTDSDGQPDSVDVETEFGDDHGTNERQHHQHRMRSGETVADSDNDGSLEDETAFEDSDCDNRPDEMEGSGGSDGSVDGSSDDDEDDSIDDDSDDDNGDDSIDSDDDNSGDDAIDDDGGDDDSGDDIDDDPSGDDDDNSAGGDDGNGSDDDPSTGDGGDDNGDDDTSVDGDDGSDDDPTGDDNGGDDNGGGDDPAGDDNGGEGDPIV